MFFNTYCQDISMNKPFEVDKITGQMVQASFSRTAESAGALDGWSPKELSLLSMKTYERIADLLNQIEEGAPVAQNHHPCKGCLLRKSWGPGGTSHELQTSHDNFTTLPMLCDHETRMHVAMGERLGSS